MKIENQVCTLKQAIKLKELGVAQQSTFWHLHLPGTDSSTLWCLTNRATPNGNGLSTSEIYNLDNPINNRYAYSAFTVAELGVMLGNCLMPSFHTTFQEWEVPYSELFCKTESEARASFLISKIEIGSLTIEEVNKRLLEA